MLKGLISWLNVSQRLQSIVASELTPDNKNIYMIQKVDIVLKFSYRGLSLSQISKVSRNLFLKVWNRRESSLFLSSEIWDGFCFWFVKDLNSVFNSAQYTFIYISINRINFSYRPCIEAIRTWSAQSLIIDVLLKIEIIVKKSFTREIFVYTCLSNSVAQTDVKYTFAFVSTRTLSGSLVTACSV